ncbi:hypothetical protein RIF29_07252 [Crotalaria pallida]|uniref:RING-type E3 ubiquitin transferase n=1 Tax=Crotalaria pallida TaxID=3830 RepID=A0AAN9J3Y6_CROPI
MSDTNPTRFTMSPPPAPPSKDNNKSSMPMLYYGLAMVGAAAIALILYNLITFITKACNRRQMQQDDEVVDVAMGSSMSYDNSRINLLSSFKFKKEAAAGKEGGSDDYECSVCLSDLEEGEEVRKLPRCKHSFHVQCIDMWLHSHFDCPVCRTPVGPSSHRFAAPENIPQGLLATGGILV